MVTDGNSPLWSEPVMKAVATSARRALKAHSQYVEIEDLQSEGYVWVAANGEKVAEVVEGGDKQQLKWLQNDIYRAMHRYCMKQRYLKDGTEPGDYFFYSPVIVEELLPEALSGDDARDSSPTDVNAGIRASKPVNERGDRAAMIADIQVAFKHCTDDDKALLLLRFAEGGNTEAVVAASMGRSESTVSYQLKRALKRIAASLGGEAFEGRVAISNARAQYETRRNEG